MRTDTADDKFAMSLRIPYALKDRIDTYAAGKGISRTAAIAILLDRRLTEIEQENARRG